MMPTEIVDYILSLLHSDQDYTTLETCAIVFPHVVDRHLYSKIIIYASSDPTNWDPMPNSILNFNKGSYVVDATQFSQVLTDRPHVGNYVHVIQVTLNLNSPLPNGAHISSILSKLSQLESISLGATRSLSWSVLDHDFHTAFLNSIRLPSIKKVAIFNIDAFSLNTFDYCKNLKALQIYGQCTDGYSLSPSSYPRLCSLGVDRRPDWTRLVSWSNNLHTLSLRMHSRQEFLQFRTLLEACRNTLVKLELNCWGISSRGTSKRFCDLHKKKLDEILLPFRSDLQSSTVTPVFPELQLPVLEHIVFRSYVIVTSPGAFGSSLPSLVPVLTSIKTISTLSPIHLTICLKFVGPLSVRDIDWSHIAAILILPIFHHPVELCINLVDFPDLLALFKQNSDMKRLLGDEKLILINDRFST